MKKRAIVYCENQFGTTDGKTANGLIREPGNYIITAVIDSSKQGQDAGRYLDNKFNSIPICKDLEDALLHSGQTPDDFIFGIAPTNAFLKPEEREVIIEAMKAGLNIINPLQEFLTDDEEMMACARECGVTIRDIRKPRPKKEWTLFTGEILNINTPVVAVLGTDGACGKRTTAKFLERGFREKGYKPAFIATGQTGLIQGAQYGFAMDAFPLQFLIGELEREVLRANKNEHPDIIIVEGQGALSHPAYASSVGILKGARPQAVILQHAPKRKILSDFPFAEVPKVEDEISLIEHFGKTKVIGITLNHESMTDGELEETIREYEETYHLPVSDVLKTGTDKMIDAIIDFFPSLKKAVVS
ncbi:hypothetical protein BpJC7_13600 [Weizmannia acidilactici]|uniref:EBNA-1 nuclear protein n=1 Tax=Weizmannia acidilactici TaxID=2607726 RepID=A0A5J4JHX4_9BACI|nr:DUF1611 domain-containing protein [Weizmannia acidilactici]GER67340.1 hypothetical protein BpJC4_18110 [Weizmannia acidilactici]GER70057.1 hypothetical protein BpJC7_13600 [Weizmannia acidilactici]GER74275.1 hypothetical protein BpPP18_23420 [Weizmannia acidilactici]